MNFIFLSVYLISGELPTNKIPANSDVVVKYSPGGSGAAAQNLIAQGRVKIDGECYSACAFAFGANSSACFTKNARFMFHGARDPGTNSPMKQATEYWLQQMPVELRWYLYDIHVKDLYFNYSQMSYIMPNRKCK